MNSASTGLLSYVAGLGPVLARRIVEYREENGPFRSKSELLKVKGMGSKAFEQCAGFIRIRDGESVLDNTGIHPESYDAAERLMKRCDIKTIGPREAEKISGEMEVGPETLKDIILELRKPGFDPREDPFQRRRDRHR